MMMLAHGGRLEAQMPASSSQAFMVDAGTKAGERPDVTDELGRVRYGIVFRVDALNAYSRSAMSSDRDRFGNDKDQRMVNLVVSFERRYDLHAIDMTSDGNLTNLTLTAYLTQDQVEAISQDQDVERMIRDTGLEFSSAVWSDQLVSGETRSWGKMAVNNSNAPSAGSVRVYVIDSGVGKHSDLNVVARINAYDLNPSTDGYLVGCYAHATHVAGIIGAKADGVGSVGVWPGTAIVSVAISNPASDYNSANHCLNDPSNYVQGIENAIDRVIDDISKNGHVGIVNLSINGPQFKLDSVLRTKLASLITPTASYPGAFVVQSAGNHEEPSENVAYGPPSPNDGYMVIGGINNFGQAVVMLNGLPAFRNPGIGNEEGTNYGSYVEAWAPSVDIYAPFVAGKQSGLTTYSTYGKLSGTSMAAPHVAGLAAYLVESGGLTTPSSIENSIRSHFSMLGSTDKGNMAINLPTVSPLAGTRNKPFGEFAISARCFDPPFRTTSCPPASMSVERPNGTLAVYTDETYNVSFDSRGSGSYTCDVYRSSPAVAIPFFLGQMRQGYWGGQFPDFAGFGGFVAVGCEPGSATFNGIYPPASHWYYGGIEVTGQTVTYNPANKGLLHFAADPVAVSCDVSVSLASDPWNPTNYNGVSLNLPVPLSSGTYQYSARCEDALGAARNSSMLFMR
ncbi:MAG: S8 family serine peptidase [Tahibacter sp.]